MASELGLIKLQGAAKAAESALKLLEKGDLERAQESLQRAQRQLEGLHEPAHSRRQRVGRRMLDAVAQLAALVAQDDAEGDDMASALKAAERSLKAAQELR